MRENRCQMEKVEAILSFDIAPAGYGKAIPEKKVKFPDVTCPDFSGQLNLGWLRLINRLIISR